MQLLCQDCTFVMLCWPPNSHSRDEQYKPMVVNLFAKGR